MPPIKRKMVYEGKRKVLYESQEPGTLILHFKDVLNLTAPEDEKTVLPGKGVINNRISEFIFTRLGNIGIGTHFIKILNMREQLIKAADILPFKIVVRNVAAGSITKRLGIEEGIVLPKMITEFCLKSENFGNPLVNDDHIVSFRWADSFELDEIKIISMRINDFLSGLFLGVGIRLIDLELEFGRIMINDMPQLVLTDEISLDTCRLWDINTNERLDRERYLQNADEAEKVYIEVAKRLKLHAMEEDDEESID